MGSAARLQIGLVVIISPPGTGQLHRAFKSIAPLNV